MIDQIEITGSSVSFRVYKCRIDDIKAAHKKILSEGIAFDISNEEPGFHDCDNNGKMIRGFYSCIIPFEVEHLVDGITTKTLHKRIESCEFLAMDGVLFVMGKSAPQKPLCRDLSRLTGYGAETMELEFHQLSEFANRLDVKSVDLCNPKDKEIRTAKLKGQIEAYEEYNVIDPRNHGIDKVSGLIDSPLGPMTITISRKGVLRFGVRKGFILTMDCLMWAWGRIVGQDYAPAMQPLLGTEPETESESCASVDDSENTIELSGSAMGGKAVRITREKAFETIKEGVGRIFRKEASS